MAFSKQTMVRRVRVLLGDVPFQDICTEAMDTTETGLDVADTTLWDVGNIVEFSDDGEQCLVTALASATTLTVVRNYNFSVTATVGTGTSHSISTPIINTPAYAYVDIVDAVDASIRSLWPYVYKAVTETLTPQTDGNHWYNAAQSYASILELSSVRQIKGTGATSTIKSYGVRGSDRTVSGPFYNIPTGKAATGVAFFIPRLWDQTNSIVIVGIAKLTAGVTTGSYDDFSEGFEADCVMYYAVARLVAAKDIPRTTLEDVSMPDQTIQPMSRTRLAAYWERKAQDLRETWKWGLGRTLPRMGVWGSGNGAN